MSRSKRNFASVKELEQAIMRYFDEREKKPVKNTKATNDTLTKRTAGNNAEQPTLTGLAYSLGFNSRQEFEACEAKGKYSAALKRARLRIEALYEEKLHCHSSGGAVFALKSMGWNERNDKPATGTGNNILKVEVTNSGPQPAATEKDVIL